MSILDCRGQEGAILRLQRARSASRVPHGYIFHGPEGVGKGMLAWAWAKLMLCGQPLQITWSQEQSRQEAAGDIKEIDDSCGECDDCKMVDARTHPDLHIIDKDLGRFSSKKRSRQLIDLPIDVIREFVIEPAGVRPARGRNRIFIIEEAQSMNRAAQNALLKTLEEPPASTFLVLITSGPEQFLPTVRSRCQMVRFVGLPREFVFEKLTEAGIEESQAGYWADFCEGRLGPALMLARMELETNSKTKSKAKAKIKTSIYEQKYRLIEELSQLDHRQVLIMAAKIVELAKQFAQSYTKEHPERSSGDAERKGQSHWLDIIVHTYSLALRWAATGRDNLAISLDQPDSVERIARRYGASGCAEAIRATYRARRGLEGNVNPSLIFECLMLEYQRIADSG